MAKKEKKRDFVFVLMGEEEIYSCSEWEKSPVRVTRDLGEARHWGDFWVFDLLSPKFRVHGSKFKEARIN